MGAGRLGAAQVAGTQAAQGEDRQRQPGDHLGEGRPAQGVALRVAEGQTVTVFYAAPNSGGTPGRFSFTPPPPPPTNGYKVVQIAILWICGGILLAILLAALALLVFVMAA